jgi:hypothetical protein
MFKEINTFDNVFLYSPNSLIICDIDDTLLYFPNLNKNKYDEIFRYNTMFTNNSFLASYYTNLYWNKLILETNAKHTDLNGFSRLILRINNFKSNLCFLTARSGNPENITFTKNNFSQIGLDYNLFPVIYSSMTPKGNFIKSNINLNQYSQIIFIDDLDTNLQNVYENFGTRIECYKFIKNI